MKKKIVSILLIGTMAASLMVGCGKKDSEQTNDTTVSQETNEQTSDTNTYAIEKDNVKVAQYKGVSANGYDTSVSEADVDSFIDYVLQYTTLSETNETASEESSEDASTEETSTEETTETPALTHDQLTDELVVKISDGQYSTVADYRNYVKDTIKSQNESYYAETIKNDLFNSVLNSSVLGTYSEEDLAKYVKYANEYYAEYAEYLGIDLNTLITENMNLKSEDEFNEYVQNEARQNLLREYVINAIAEAEGIAISDGEIATEIQKYIDQGYFATEEEVLEYISKDEIALNLKYYKILEIIYSNANIVPFETTTEVPEEATSEETVEPAENVEVVEEDTEAPADETSEEATTETSNE